ncbi:hypothetical protein K2173_013855 [Erythroxylum novogranatense]|uniref:F-box protein n=1 Tax=Erythroxylum novogranatense TaxID=1862640 RepID=A0AAV8SD95_9ROSI|nr:hypothetical protein K2173_013855 [Erythroxylum novogranatense]
MDALSQLSPESSGSEGNISALHPDIVQTRILTLLDGPTLTSIGCASPEFHALSTEESLWKNICASTWPSTDDPLVNGVVSTFAAGHRTLFSDAYPLIHGKRKSNLNNEVTATQGLISAVDIYYQNVPIFSKVVETETVTEWFMCSPFRIELLEPKDYSQTWDESDVEKENQWIKQLEENITLSWIVIDPELKRAVNVSSERPVSVSKHWLTGEAEMKFATIVEWEREPVKWEVVVACGGKEGGEADVTEVSMGIEDMEGKRLNGKDSLVILRGAMEGGERRKRKEGVERERYEEFTEGRRVWRERRRRRENALDMLCITVGLTLIVSFGCFIWLW